MRAALLAERQPSSRRLDPSLRAPSHAGLVLQRLLPTYADRETQLAAHADLVAGVAVPAEYRIAYQRWRKAVHDLGGLTADLTAAGPVAVGLGNASPMEVGLTLHHTYGVPYLPGSALKGLALRAAARTGVSDHDRRVIFGSDEDPEPAAAYATFWDGWLMPDQPRPLRRDVITVHHPRYYASHGTDAAPTDFDDPNPVVFLSVKPGTRFMIAISCAESEAVAGRALQLVRWGLAHLGIGGKTNAGYGRLT